MDHPPAPPLNPHFDQDRVAWQDAYSGEYQPVAYDEQFDAQWRYFLEKRVGFHNHTGVETSDVYINDRIAELTGVRNAMPVCDGSDSAELPEDRGIGGRLYLDPKFPIDFFRGKRCLDIGCGAGRWTRALTALGGIVKSVDMAPAALESTRRFNDDVEALNLFDIAGSRPDLHRAFDFTLCWGVVMCTHDPRVAFANVARTVKPGGHLYLMVYAPTYHASEFVLSSRKTYHRDINHIEDKLNFAYSLVDDPRNAINALDMLNTFYNWVIPENVILDWFQHEEFEDVKILNRMEPHYCAFHVLGRKA